MNTKLFKSALLLGAVSAFSLLVALALPSQAQGADDSEIASFDIPEMPLSEAIAEFSRQSSITVIAPSSMTDGRRSLPIFGSLEPGAALLAMLGDANLDLKKRDDGSIILTQTQLDPTPARPAAEARLQRAPSQTIETTERNGNFVRETIIVTAQRREQSIRDVPMSTVAYDEIDLEERLITDISDLGSNTPGLIVQASGDFERRVYLRGVANTFGSQSQIGIYIDEVATSGGNPRHQLNLRTYDLERIEILRGPQGTLYGQGSMGGTIKFVTKKPVLDEFGSRADLAVAFTEGGSPSQTVQSMINVPLSEDKLALRIAGTFEHRGGWIDRPDISTEDFNDGDLSHVRAKLLWEPIEGLSVTPMVLIHRNEGAPSIGEDENGDFLQAFGAPGDPTTQDDFEIYNLTATYDVGSVQVLSSTSYIDIEKTTRNFGSTFSTFGLDTLYDEFSTPAEIFSQELRFSSAGDGPLSWTVGAFYQDVETEGVFSFISGPPAAAASLSQFVLADNTERQSWAVFGDLAYALTDRLEIGGGVRYFEDEQSRIDFPTLVGGVPTGPALMQDDGDFDSVDPRAYLRYAVTDDINLYASASKGFRSGGYNRLGQPTYDSESLWTYEIGAKSSLFNGALTSDIALFYTEYDDYQVRGNVLFNGAPIGIISNAGEAEIKGVDWTFLWTLSDAFSFEFNGNYVDTEFVSVNATNTINIVGDRLPDVPEYHITIAGNYDFQFDGKPGYARLDYSQTGPSESFDRRLGIFGESDEINMLNFHLSWDWSENLSLGVFGRNLLDDRDLVNASEELGIAFRSRPRTLGFEISADF